MMKGKDAETPQVQKSTKVYRSLSPKDKPTALVVHPDNIPAMLRGKPRWVLWRYELRDTTWTKVPHQPNGRRASSTDAATWSSFGTVVSAYRAGGWDGIGF